MKIPVAYELNGRRRCLLVQDGETISVGRATACSIRLDGEAVQEVELTAQFVNGCQFVVVHPANGSVPYAQPLPWKLKLGGQEVEMLRPYRPEQGAAGKAGREMFVQGLSTGEVRLVWQPDQPLLLGSSQACDVIIPDASCPAVLLTMWSVTGGKVLVQVLDDAAVVGWLGRAGESEAELDLPVSLSVGGRVILIRSGEAASMTQPVSKPVASAAAAGVVVSKAPAILAKSADTGPKIVARQKAEQPDKPTMQAPQTARVPIALPRPTGVSVNDDRSLLTEPEISTPKPYSPTLFLLVSWLLVMLMFAVALLPQQGVLTPEQILQMWYAAGGTLILALVLGLGVLLK